ncbi:MAG: hypothetical protein U9N76_05705 [Candidatus Marinimicrobia bacterium]|nr:hypothetical protein [Candidatus Neomarinimicrobiota bacterium]
MNLVNKKHTILSIFFILVITSSFIFSQEKDRYYYYNPKIDYGSDLLFNPFGLLINGSYDMMRVNRFDRSITKQSYKLGMQNVNDNLLHPFYHIEHFGYDKFFKQEFFNFSLDFETAGYMPNIGLHILGNGMEYAKLSEWYDYHNVPYPKLFSIITTTSYQYLNEVIENGSYQGTNVDPIADMLFFNPVGIILFSFEPIQNFFSEKLPIYSWPLQPMINPQNLFIENGGQQYASRLQITKNENISLFFNWGLSAVFGMSYKLENKKNISFGIGGYMNNLVNEEYSENRFVSGYIDYAVGIYYDKNNSLLSSVLVTGPKAYNLRINVYPNLINIKGIKPGFFLGVGEMDNFTFGINIAPIPIGIAGQIR